MAGWAVMAVVMAALWLVQRRTRNAAIVDVAWSFGTGILAAAFALATDGWFPRRILVAGLAGFWGLRLGSYLMARVRADGEEDVRYREFRRQYGGNIQPFLFGFFQLQAVWAVLFAIPMLFAARNPIPAFGLLDFVGILIWVVALSGEGLADRQLARFRNDPANRGAVCRTGPLVGLRGDRDRRPARLGHAVRTGRDVRLPDEDHRHSASRAATPGVPRRRLSGIPEDHESLLPLATPEDRMSTTALMLGPAIGSAERGWVPDALVRWGIRRLCKSMWKRSVGPEGLDSLVAKLKNSEIALVPDLANDQHYEVPPEFFHEVLGERMKYSCCHWSEDTATLDAAEVEALEITSRRAQLENGLDVLELGCGWGSLTLWMAEHFPQSRITGLTNSELQARFVRARAAERGYDNVHIVREDMNRFDTDARFDRVVSIEMMEHMRNYEALFARIAGWLRPEGKLFVHVFRHQSRPYLYGSGTEDWMGRHFFSGGIMPSRDLFARFDRDLRVLETWDWSGEHYRRTAEAWLTRLDDARDRILSTLAQDRGAKNAELWLNRWRLFFLSCAELFGYAGGSEWGVSHYLLEPVRRGDQ
jgi:cyclopropane-fatty-acyl-phospholipid synthase